ncbi:hypothetical protein RAMDARK_0576 [Rickettsia amblyommatis str. Darkwater]|uniref:Uncharacterized protein n=1 Tax=Rickettsia amblyommatis str. Ac/Pa TaxID=1359164 RepID=A0A0F3N1S2_RICAM|nr:hypothetical protein APHACPA_0842 [Rickettsia amblyommatis str. Ac/Pa]KJV96794.1 hypothetical protein RAMDARK_0576 [Rickettsia amblyommatis str. Darkwater]
MAYGLVKFNAPTSKVDRIKRLRVVNCVIMISCYTFFDSMVRALPVWLAMSCLAKSGNPEKAR